MDDAKSTFIRKAIEEVKGKGNEAITKALIEALEKRQCDLKRREAA